MPKKISTLDNTRTPVSEDADVKDEVRVLASDLRRSALEVAWRQWQALGASAALHSNDSRRLQSTIDPEALVLLSLVMIEDEQRLADLVHDWMVLNSDLLSVQRVKNLAKEYSEETQARLKARLEWLAEAVLRSGKDFRWRSLISSDREGQRHGVVIRSGKPWAVKSRAVRAPLTEPSTLLLRLRLGFGVGVKADVLGFLLGTRDEWIIIREIAEATAYSPVAVRRAVDDLAAARLVLVSEVQPAGYRTERKDWVPLLRLHGPPVWLNWHQRFTFVSAFLAWADSVEKRPLSAYAFGAQGRELLEQHRRAFGHHQLVVWSMHTEVRDWRKFVREAVQSLASSMVKLA